MGQSNDKYVAPKYKATKLDPRLFRNQKNGPPPSHAMFNPEKLNKLSSGVGNLSLNEIEGHNGLVFCGVFIPREIIAEILDYLDYKSLIKCQLVCKQWAFIIRNFTWRYKAERLLHRPLPTDEKALWTVFYAICDKKIAFGKNLLKHDYQNLASYWCNLEGKISWYITRKYFRAPKDPNFNSKSVRYIIENEKCWKRQVVNLIQLDFPQYLLDNLQPIIKISEWYRCRRDSPGKYECKMELIKLEEREAGEEVKHTMYDDVIIDSHYYSRTFENRNHRGTWRKFKHQFRNYGKGLNRIRFYHGGQNNIEIGGTWISVEIPRK